VNEFKVMFKKKADGKIKDIKPLAIALGSDGRGGKFIVTIFS
jgi:hypothetical protein